MTEQRLRAMQRIAKLQTQMRRREEWRLADLERSDGALAERQTQLTTFIEAETSVSALMAAATARRLRSVAEARAALAQQKTEQTARILAHQQRVVCAERLCDALGAAHERSVEDDALASVVEADMSRRQTSLP